MPAYVTLQILIGTLVQGFLSLLSAAMTPSFSGSSSGFRFLGISCILSTALWGGIGGIVRSSANETSSSPSTASSGSCSASLN